VFDSHTARAGDLASKMNVMFAGQVATVTDTAEAVRSADGVVNTTPVGMAKYPGTSFDTALLTAEKWVADIIYFPTETELLRAARAIGCRTLPGIGMAINQAVRAFELFTGHKADRRAMADHFEAAA
jgi:shikimate dehydrogenase